MKAVVKTGKGPGLVELKDIAEPTPKPNEVLIEIKAAGICGSDIHIYHDEHPYWPPVILGHEFSGVIKSVGEEVKGWRPGARVVAEPHTRACGVCYLCRTGNIQLCSQKRAPGWGIDGAFAKYLVMPYHLLHSIPEGVSFAEAALAEPAAIAVSALERSLIQVEHFVVAFGPGPIGLLSAMVAKGAGASQVILIGRTSSAKRLQVARELNIDHVVDSNKQDILDLVGKLTHEQGADLVVDASGAQEAIAKGIEMLRRGGRFCAIGVSRQEEIGFPWDKALFKACNLTFCFSSSYTSWDKALSMMASGKIKAKLLVGGKWPLEEWSLAFQAVERREVVKALLIP